MNEREVIINSASSEYDRTGTGLHRITSRRSWINQALRDKGLSTLNEAELLNVRTDGGMDGVAVVNSSALVPGNVSGERKTIIAKASSTYDTEGAGMVKRLCSRLAWINQALRDRSLPEATADELRQFPE
jgi:hypothetical protein